MSTKKALGRGPVLGPRLRIFLYFLFAVFAVMGVNSVYLLGVRFLEWRFKQTFQDYFYQYMFLVHLVLGLIMILPVIVFGILHFRKARHHRNQRAAKVGYGLFTGALILLISGLFLTRLGVFEIKEPTTRTVAYWAHVITPLLVVWLYVLHRLAGKRIKWKMAGSWAVATVILAGLFLFFQSQDPRQWNVTGPKSGEKYFFPSLSRTATGNFIPAQTLMNDDYCQKCHPDIHENWSYSMHRFSSFNNPAYLFSVRESRDAFQKRDGNVHASRFCAGCHDPVPFFSGEFDNPDFDDVNHPTAKAGITCTVCHAITHINSNRGNADYTIEEPLHYPFAFSDVKILQWVNERLIKAKPEFHKKTFLKPLHQSAEFCGACHKVHLGEEINHYKWIRGQNHYDSFWLSGVSGQGVQSFYYPPQAQKNCNGCHMKAVPSDDFGARYLDETGVLKVHDHQFPSANTAIPFLKNLPEKVNEAHRRFLEGNLRVDIFGVRSDGEIDGALEAPIRPRIPLLEPGKTYLFEIVVRTLTLGHHFTQGTADSNEVWLDVAASADDRIIGRSGAMDAEGGVDPWSHFINAYVLDRDGARIDRRNAQDIFVPLYNHQIPPGASDVIHYRLTVPDDGATELTLDVRLKYRKFDATFMKYVMGQDYINQLPIVEMARDKVRFPIGAAKGMETNTEPDPIAEVPVWQRWNDYGIGLLRKGSDGGSKGQLRQAEEAFAQIRDRADGPLNRARIYFREGRLDEATTALNEAAALGGNWWSIAWFSGLVDKQNGYLDEALANFRKIIENAPHERGFDFSKDYRLLNEYAQTLFERAKQERADPEVQTAFLRESVKGFQAALALDSENVAAHYNLYLLYTQLGEHEKANEHQRQHARYKPDDNVRDRAVSKHRAENPAADHAAEDVVIYDLQRSMPPLEKR